MNIYIYKYNNYYNRIVKFENDYSEFEYYGPLLATNFVPADGINTTHTIGSNAALYDGKGDYLIVYNNDNTINSRWFIIEATRIRGGQFVLQLRRDLLVDYYYDIIKADMFIEKATLPLDNPLIFNSENVSFNEIKTNETLLKDQSRCPWLVGYYAKDIEDFSGTVKTNSTYNAISIGEPTIESWDFYQYSQTDPMIGPPQTGFYEFKCAMGGALDSSCFEFSVNEASGDTSRKSIPRQTTQLQYLGAPLTSNKVQQGFVSYGLDLLDASAYSNAVSEARVNELLEYQGKLIKTEDGKYYRITISDVTATNSIAISSGALFNGLTAITTNLGFIGTPTTNTFRYKFTSSTYYVSILEEKNLSTTYNLNSATKMITEDAPWNIFAIPYGDNILIKDTIHNTAFRTNKEISLALAASIQSQHPNEVYDIQLLPYCPVPDLVLYYGELAVYDESQFSYVVNQGDQTNVGIIFNVPKSNFSITITDYKIPTTQSAIERKLNNECDKWRLTSPNYSNYFEFSAEKNNGVESWNVDCNYKPFTPYIHVNPAFNLLYGQDFNDPRGLVCGGDFSISQIIDQWKQYEIQNKHYQATFDRQIQDMEIKNKYGRIQDIANAAFGTVQGAVGGAYAGNLLGSGPLGAAIGGSASLLGGVADVTLNQKLRNEALDYTKDLFGYQLANIQALPQTISKVSALNANNKIFPVLEYYTCSEEEKKMLLDKIAYNSMTVMAIGKIQSYLGNEWEYQGKSSKGYIKGKLIRFTNINEDYHVVNAISGELDKGAYYE